MLNRKIAHYKKVMGQAPDYETWKEAALELDYLLGHVDWKEAFVSDLYNYDLIYDRLQQLREYHQKRQHNDLVRSLREGLHHDLGNMGNPALYQVSHVGTKHLIEEYVNQVCESLNYVCDTPMECMHERKKLEFFKDTLISFGRPALLLSGGASLGMFHIGVVKALWERGLLPQVITGSSVGSIIASMIGTRTDAELPELLMPERHNLKAWRWRGVWSAISGQGLMDQQELERCLRTNIGEYTFEEAFQRSGRSINVTVSPVHLHQKERLLSGYTSPYMLVWSASLASCAVPGIFPPVMLMKKDDNGSVTPYMSRLRWVDGSVTSDLPIERLMHLYDVNYSIVSQTNPHIVPFLNRQERKKKSSLLSIPTKMVKAEVQFHGKALFDYLRKNSEPELFRQVAGHAYTILAQRYSGDVTIAPRYTLRHYASMLSNPTPAFVQEMILQGERATWPKIAMIRTHSKISTTLERCIARLKARIENRRAELRVIA